MSADGWTATKACEVQPGDRLRLGSGTDMTVTRIETPFLGQSTLVCFVEDTEVRWLAIAMASTAEVTVSTTPQP
jgi:hypothetical protein